MIDVDNKEEKEGVSQKRKERRGYKHSEKPLEKRKHKKRIEATAFYLFKGEEQEVIRGLRRDPAFLDFLRENYEIQEQMLPGCLGVNDPTMKRKKLIRKRDDQLLNVWEVRMEEET